ncbi:pimeloyl-ACP methyl ester carboxylesterase [Haematococcus lacustris]|uniref:Pimeloyl-ACP methyl ester carboxylesterase n=1 Tax=Haematococcus lacustris TaxID=44745 RepID=A0A699YES8_HAELA|nr:pimeloyl-ACP methyl ester carboxylesterase [Haematococcus lacustris]
MQQSRDQSISVILDFEPLVEQLLQDKTLRARLLLVDMLGYGDSDKGVGEARFSISQQANVVQAVWARFNVKRTHLVVHDFAVSVAQELLSKQPKGRLPIPIHKQRLMADMTGWLTARSLTQSAFEQVVGGVFSREHPPPRQWLTDIHQALQHRGGAQIHHKLVRFIKDRHRYKHIWQGALELAMRFDSSRMMFFWGAQDPMSGAHVAEELKRRFGRYNVKISVHADLGHWPHIEDPARVAQALTAFIAEPWTPVWPVVAESGSATSPTMEKGSSVSVHNGSVHYPEGKSGHRRQSMALERNSKIPGSALDRTSGIPRTVQRSNSVTDENTFVQKPCPSPSASTTMLNAVNAAAKLEVEAVPAIV